MKRGWKIFWITMVMIAVIGLGCCAVALTLGFSFYNLRISSGNQMVEYLDDEDENLWMSGESGLMYFENITDLELDIDACELLIIADSEESIRIDTSDITGENSEVELDITEKNGKLRIETREQWNDAGGIIRIYIPDDIRFETVKMEVDACDVQVNGLAAELLHVEVAASACKINNMNVGEVEAELEAGSLDINGAYTSENLSLECAAGDMNLTLNVEQEAYDYRIECDMGDVEIDGKEYGGFSKESSIDNNAEKMMYIDCDAGSVWIDFSE